MIVFSPIAASLSLIMGLFSFFKDRQHFYNLDRWRAKVIVKSSDHSLVVLILIIIDFLHLMLSIISLTILQDMDDCASVIGPVLLNENIILIVLGFLKLILTPLVIIVLGHYKMLFGHL